MFEPVSSAPREGDLVSCWQGRSGSRANSPCSGWALGPRGAITSCSACGGTGRSAIFFDPRSGWTGINPHDFDRNVAARRTKLAALQTSPPTPRLPNDTVVRLEIDGIEVVGSIFSNHPITLLLPFETRKRLTRTLILAAGYAHFDAALELDRADLSKYGPREELRGFPLRTGRPTIEQPPIRGALRGI